jgi:hypothetical protein
MVGELRTLDGLRLWIDGKSRGDWGWSLVVPRDDGTLEALATALALTDGEAAAPIEGLATDRLGGPGSAWIGRRGEIVVVSGSRTGLAEGWNRWSSRSRMPRGEPGFHARIDAEVIASAPDIEVARWGKVLEALRVRGVRVRAGIEEQRFRMVVRGELDGSVEEGPGRVDLSWLRYVPAGASAAMCWGFSPTGETLDRGFRAVDSYLDRGEGEPRTAPVRARVNVVANLAGVRPEVEIWPGLRGITAFVVAGKGGRVEQAVLVMHVAGEAEARRLATRVLPRLVKVSGRAFEVRADGASVVIGWGAGAVELAVEARREPEGAAGAIWSEWGGEEVSRCGAFWPGRWPGWVGEPTVGEALKSAPPVVWWGRREGREEVDRVVWGDLKGTVGRWVEAVAGLAPGRTGGVGARSGN